MQYSDKLKYPDWQKRRLKILERDNWRCTYCGNNKSILDVHHKFYLDIDNPADYSDDLLITLCRKCHEKENERPKCEKALINTLKMQNFMVGDLMTLSCKLETDLNFTKQLIKILREFSNG